MRWPWVTRKTLERERVAALARHDQGITLERQVGNLKRRQLEDVFEASLLPFVERWTHADARMVGERVAVTIYVHAQTIAELARDPTIADYLGRTLGGQFAAELRSLRLVEMMHGQPRRDLW